MRCTTGPKRAVDSYFRAWQTHSVSDLQGVFSEEAKYEIIPIDKTLVRLKEIREYWSRNRERQRDLSVEWSIESLSGRLALSSFVAKFYDIEECESQIISGRIVFVLSRDWKIAYLSEIYDKEVLRD
jgi:hypothetical protein